MGREIMQHEVIKFEPNSIDKFKALSSRQWWEMFGRQGSFYKTVDHDKYSKTIFNLVRLKSASEYVTGRFVAELIGQIQREVDDWNDKYYKDPSKQPEYVSARKWFDDHYNDTRVSWKTAGRYLWIYQNVDPEFSDLGYRKNKAVEDFLGNDEEYKKKFRKLIRDSDLNETEVEKTLEIFIDRIGSEAQEQGLKESTFKHNAKERIFKEIQKISDLTLKNEIDIKKIYSEGTDAIISCGRIKDAAKVRDVLIAMEQQIKLKAYKRKK